jgi:hypothetical protein
LRDHLEKVTNSFSHAPLPEVISTSINLHFNVIKEENFRHKIRIDEGMKRIRRRQQKNHFSLT